MFSKATKIDEIFTNNLTLCSKCQIDGEDFVNFSGLLRKYELYFERSKLHFKIQKVFHSNVSGLAKALRENDDAPDDDDDYGSHSGPRESGGRGAESPLPPPFTHTSPTRF